eukprot:5099418-Amphidinium_carterae.2
MATRCHATQAFHDRQVRREYKCSGLDDKALGPGVGGQPPQADELRTPTSGLTGPEVKVNPVR